MVLWQQILIRRESGQGLLFELVLKDVEVFAREEGEKVLPGRRASSVRSWERAGPTMYVINEEFNVCEQWKVPL